MNSQDLHTPKGSVFNKHDQKKISPGKLISIGATL